MKKFYNSLGQAKRMGVSFSTKRDKERFCNILQDLSPDYAPQCRWLRRALDGNYHLEFIDNRDLEINKKKQIAHRVRKQLEIEEGFNQKAIDILTMAFMIIGDWDRQCIYHIVNEYRDNTKESENKIFLNSTTHKNLIDKESLDFTKKKQEKDNPINNSLKTVRVSATVMGEILKVETKLGAHIAEGDTILWLKAGTTKLKIVAPEGGRICSIAIEGRKVYRGDTIAIINTN